MEIRPPGTPHFFNCFKDFIYLFLEREKERERNINVWLPLTCPLLGTWPTTQACALTGNRTGNTLTHRLALSPLSHTSQSWNSSFLKCMHKMKLKVRMKYYHLPTLIMSVFRPMSSCTSPAKQKLRIKNK